MAQGAPQDSAGPSSPPPPLPDGWLAQWEGVSRRWYFVQRATGKSQWEIPTEPVVLSPSTTPSSIGAGPTHAPQMASPVVSPVEDMGYAANRSMFSHSTERAGLSSLLGSSGGSGLTQLADRMLNKISKEFMPSKPGATPYQQFPVGHPNHPASQMYGPGGGPPPSAGNPYGYSSYGPTGTYSGNVPQYHPPGQAMSPGGYHHPQGYPQGYPQHPYPNQPAMTPQFSPVSPVSQHSWQSHRQPPPGYPPTYPAPEMQGSVDSSHANMSPVGQPQWQMGPQPTIPHATKPSPNPQQSNQYPGSPYQQNLPLHEASGDAQHVGGPQPLPHDMAGMHHHNPQQGSQHSIPFPPGSGGMPPPSAVASNYAHNSSMTPLSSLSTNPHQQGNPSQPPSLASISNTHPSANKPANSFIAELPDNQVTASQAPNIPANKPPLNAIVSELPGSEPVRHTPTDPQFVSGPWTIPPPGANPPPR